MTTPQLDRRLGPWTMLAISVGAIIGSAWLFAPLYAAQVAGPAALLSWGLSIGAALLLALVYAELGASFPVAGGLARFSYFSHGNLAGFVAGFACWLGYVAIAPIEVQAMIAYLADDWSWLLAGEGSRSLSPWGMVVATGLLLAMTAVNLLGVSWFGESNKVITAWKVVVPVLIPAMLIANSFEPANFTHAGGFMPNGWSGTFAAVSTGGTVMAMLGFRAAIEMAGEARRPERDVPFAVIGSVLITGAIYLLIQIGFLGAIPPAGLAGGWSSLASHVQAGPFVELAAAAGLAWLVKLILVDAVVSPAGCGLVFVGASARLSLAMARNGQAPASCGRLSQRGVPAVALGVNFLVGLLFFAPSQTWQSIVGFISSIQVLSLAFGPPALLALRRSLPDAPRPFRLPAVGVIAGAAFVIANLIIYWVGWETNRVTLGILAGAGVGFALLRAWRSPHAPLDLGALRWLLPWFVGLAVISALGAYGGGRGLLPAGWDLLLVAALSLVVLQCSRISPTARPPSGTDLERG